MEIISKIPVKEIFTFKRFCETSVSTFSAVEHLGEPVMVAMEPPYKNNLPFVSCILPGEYFLGRYSSAKYPNTWQILDVKGRDFVLLHWGNIFKHTQGCIILAEKFSDINGDGHADVLESKSAPNDGFNEFMNRTKKCGDREVKIIIEKALGWAA